ncbi:translation initiation factor IF-2 [Enterococcus sp. DIV1368b]|uniref:Translation initiation factor IF-2 n=3 Tax=Enterococcus TaxID=1350 RepID=A0A242L064_ENTMU|nr:MULTISPECIES: translation initiation factor IF-2 [Enterococcus]NBA62404.1 translation initiation factor IF-2 [Enterococcus mundtii]OTP27586.1 translation initiation factor IF-2 [Enterococcus mundtii]STD24664.1 translation initiation factor IF-2 [Enterococcus mundtii]
MGNKRIYELAKEWNKSSKEVVDKAQKLGIDVKNHMGAVSTQDEKKLQQAFNQPQQKKQPVQKANQKPAGQQPSNQKKTNEPSNQQKNKSNRNYQDRGQGSGQVNQGKNQSTNQNKSNQTGGNNQNRQGTTQNNNQNRQGNNQGSNQNRQGTTQGNNQGSNQNRQGTTQGNSQGSNQNRQGTAQGNTQGSNQNRQGANQGGQNRNNNNNRGKFNNNNRNRFNKKGKKGKQQTSNKPAVPPRKFRELPEVLEYTEGMNVADIAKKIHREPAEIIKKLFMLGVMVNQNQALDKDTIELLATDYGMEPQEKIQVDIADIDKFFEADEVNPEKLVSRPPVVTIMGHVDHGKTTLLDTLRHSRVTSGEAGGITQHIGAYQIDIDGKPITFLDTPGHAAFTSMRARGASITDITILVVAADDGVMPQTVEAINHAKAAGVPIIVAVNKIDKPGANPQHVMQELSEYELIPEAWGGETIFVEISAKFGQNIEELLEMILLVAEVEDLKADPTQRAIGTVIEARLDKGKGPVTTLLVQQGSLNVGDPIVVGNTYGRVRVMVNDLGRREKTAGPATPVEITGLNDVPQAGDRFVVFEDEKTARAAGEERGKRAMLEQRAATSRVTLDNLFESLKEGELKEVNVIIKADVQGSAEALAASLKKIDVEGVRVKIVHSAVGAINESDVTLAAASNAIIIGFNVRPTPQAKIQADTEEVDIRLHRIIYKAIEEIETAMKGMLDPEFEEKITGQMTVRETFKVSKVGTIAGAFVTDGYIRRDSGVRVIRDGIVIFEGQLASLKRFKDDVKEVKMGFECGAMVEKFNDLKVDDVIEGFIMEEIKVD